MEGGDDFCGWTDPLTLSLLDSCAPCWWQEGNSRWTESSYRKVTQLISPPVVLSKPLQSVDSKRPVGLVCWKSRRGRKIHQMPLSSKEERWMNKSWWVTLFCNMKNKPDNLDPNGRCYQLWLTFQMCTWQQVGHRRGSEICPPAVWK